MSKLLEPVAVKGVTLPNRFVRSATVKNLGGQGLVTDSLELLYREMVRGEVGLIVRGRALSREGRTAFSRAAWCRLGWDNCRLEKANTVSP